MQDDIPPPPRAAPPATSFPPPPPPPAVDAGANAAHVVASARSAKQLASWALGLTLAGTLCCGGGVVAIVQWLGVKAREQENKLHGAERTARMRKDTEALLETLADSLRAGGVELPETLPEAPPRDSWNHPVRYKRGARDATLTSSGPDGRFGTRDDVTIRVEAPK